MEPLRALAKLMDALRPRVKVRRLGAWIAALAILVQLAAPWIQLRVLSTDVSELFPICSSHLGDDGGSGPAGDDSKKAEHCPLCMLPLAAKLLPPEPATSTAIEPKVSVALVPVLRAYEPIVRAAVPPLPPRGPPSVA